MTYCMCMKKDKTNKNAGFCDCQQSLCMGCNSKSLKQDKELNKKLQPIIIKGIFQVKTFHTNKAQALSHIICQKPRKRGFRCYEQDYANLGQCMYEHGSQVSKGQLA